MGIDRGTTTIGSGALTSFLYCTADNFKLDAYTEINVTLKDKGDAYTQEYDTAVSEHKGAVVATLDKVAQNRYDRLFARYRQEYDAEVRAKFGADADKIGHVEVFEISEYGEEPSQEFLDILEK